MFSRHHNITVPYWARHFDYLGVEGANLPSYLIPKPKPEVTENSNFACRLSIMTITIFQKISLKVMTLSRVTSLAKQIFGQK